MKNVVKEAYTPVEVPGTSEEIQILYRGYNTLVEQDAAAATDYL